MDDLLDSLNEEQIKPVKDTEGAVLVLAGAGSGKTRVLTSRIAYIIREGKADLSQILSITFTNKAAAEMKERLIKMLGEGDGYWICTIHSMCVKILRKYGQSIGVKSNFSIYSETERNSVIKKVARELDLDTEKLKSLKYHIGNAKMAGLSPEEYAKTHRFEQGIDETVKVYSAYNEHLKNNNALDFDDLLLETLRLLKSDNETRQFLADKFKYVLVDEFQDTNAVQFQIVKLLSSVHGNIFAVGDDDQSIYGWRGAEIGNILRFDKDFAGAKVYKLERNYRSTKNILKLANEIIKNNSVRRGKTLWTDEEDGENPQYFQADEEAGEALYTAKIISDMVSAGWKYSDFAVLMRVNALTRSYEQEFTKYGIPYKVFGGFKFFERKEIKDVLAYLRLISNPFDNEAFERIINVPRRGIGDKTLQIMDEYANFNSLTLYDAALDCDELALTAKTKEKIGQFADVIKKFVVCSQDMPVNNLVRQLLQEVDFRSAYDDGTDEGDAKLANIDEFIASVDDYVRLNPDSTLDEYLNQVTLSSDLDEMDESDFVTLATIHAVKGLEFPVVFICGLEDGIMPSSRFDEEGRDMEEERRLMYVAITRARKRLYLTRSKSRYLYGRRDICRPSRFILELAAQLGVSEERPQYYYGASKRYSGGYGGQYGSGQQTGSRYPYNAPQYESSSRPQPSATAKTAGSGSFLGGFKKDTGSNPNAGKYEVGQKVRHAKFGIGTVVAIKSGGSVLNVAFDNQGIKELAAAIAPLTIIK